jgi:hypothetical protein
MGNFEAFHFPLLIKGVKGETNFRLILP